MSLKGHNILTSPFPELVAMPAALTTNSTFDIIIEEEINLQNYCTALLQKIFDLPQSQFPAFVNYQCNQVKEAERWINKLEKLLANNEQIFTSKQALSRYNKLYHLIEQKRKEVQSTNVKEVKTKPAKKYINAESEERYFSFYELKKQLENIKEEKEKILLLTREQFEYQQTNIDFINTKIPHYDVQCQKEIEQIFTLSKLQSELELAKQNNNAPQLAFNKVKINCNVNQFVDIFYQLHRELFDNGKSIIDGAVNDIVAVIVNSFVDKDGREISPETVKTILTPSKSDKRPKAHKRIDIDKML